MATEFQESLSKSCISSEPIMNRDISSSNLPDFRMEEHELNDNPVHGDEKPPMAELIKLSVKFVFMISSLFVILTPGRDVLRLPCFYLSLGSAAFYVVAVGVCFASRKKQSQLVSICPEDGEVEGEIQDKNVEIKLPVRSRSSAVEISSKENWKPVSGLEVKLVLEYSPMESSSLAREDTMEHCSVTRDGSMQKAERKTRRKSISTVTHNNVVTHDASVGSSPSSYDKASIKKEEKAVPLRRSSRIRNQAFSTPSSGTMLISSKG